MRFKKDAMIRLLRLIAVCSMLFAGCSKEPVSPRSEPEPASSEQTEYVSPIDFDYLKGESSDIYAWITVPGSKVDYPVLSHEGDEDFYLRRDIYGKYSFAGSLYTQSGYNKSDFSDRVTIIYGHNMTDETYFGGLQRIYSDPELFEENNTFTIYMPDRELHYEVIASLPFGDRHVIRLYGGFTEDRDVVEFLDYAFSVNSPIANHKRDFEYTGAEKLVILQTCQYPDYSQRYLTVGMLIDREPPLAGEVAEPIAA